MKHVLYLTLDNAFEDLHAQYCALTGFESDFPPHISLLICDEEPQDFAGLAGSLLSELQALSVQFSSLGAFMTSENVLYLSPIKDQQLLGVQKALWDQMGQIVPKELHKFYAPENWVPHSTIGFGFDMKGFANVFDHHKDDWNEKRFPVTAIELAKTNPFHVISSMPVNV